MNPYWTKGWRTGQVHRAGYLVGAPDQFSGSDDVEAVCVEDHKGGPHRVDRVRAVR